jgi:aspartate/methionine/tyrosine aminotransferase
MKTDLFRLRPPRAAKVSEISEATAASPAPPEERVNFHIGNPVQDPALYAAFMRLALGLSFPESESRGTDVDALLTELGAGEEDRQHLEFLQALITRSAPYMPRGGYQRTAPNELVQAFATWVEKGQPDPLSYDYGKTSGVREVILATGGIIETFRVFLLATASYLVHTPATLLVDGLEIPDFFHRFPHMRVVRHEGDEESLLDRVAELAGPSATAPVFLGLGRIFNEETRRRLRELTLSSPLFIIEANDAPNSLSLARESRMSKRVLRFMTPGVFSERLKGLPTVFVAGSPDFVTILEVTHFQVKGTPSAPEVEHLARLLAMPAPGKPAVTAPPDEPDHATLLPHGPAHVKLPPPYDFVGLPVESMNRVVENVVSVAQRAVERHVEILDKRFPAGDPFAGMEALELLDEFFRNGLQPEWQERLRQAFLAAFHAHHPEYDRKHLHLVSGSSRTGLGLIGLHCGVSEVIFPDLSWTYENCFPKVRVVPLTGDYQLDVAGIVRAVDERIEKVPGWISTGAVALNNPHNATGQVFHESDVRDLLKRLLSRNVLVLDDLAYQNVAASDTSGTIPTVRQIADSLYREGYITAEQAKRVVTMQSVSKTDCLAGSRLAVAEIREEELEEKFERVNAIISPNIAAIFLSYLFYRREAGAVSAYWRLRNSLFASRMDAIERAASGLPAARNRYDISIRRPTGSMYPLMRISRLPNGLSLDWLSSGLARQGIGLLPLSAFARTEEGFESGRRTFRLTLGGVDGADVLFTKTRRVLIDLNRLIAEEESNYNRLMFPASGRVTGRILDTTAIKHRTSRFIDLIRDEVAEIPDSALLASAGGRTGDVPGTRHLLRQHVDERLGLLTTIGDDRVRNAERLLQKHVLGNGDSLASLLEGELFKDDLQQRIQTFRHRLYDRTVHPTQMYSIDVERIWNSIHPALLRGSEPPEGSARALAQALVREFTGENVVIASRDEADELLLDIHSLLAAEDVLSLDSDDPFRPFLSYWGDWDGSTRPSGQGHRLVATVLIENIRGMARLLDALHKVDPKALAKRNVLDAVKGLETRTEEFRKLLDEITSLTHQLEHRYRGILPWRVATTKVRQTMMRLRLAKDPVTRIWAHNDRLERRMVTLRAKRKDALTYYFSLNKSVRKALHDVIPAVVRNRTNPALALEAVLYRDMLKRVAITPRIHQKLITAQDPFAIDTTVHNINELNEMAGSFGNSGVILGLQISMSTSPDALILLDRKLRANREEAHRRMETDPIAPVFLIPLFEEIDSVQGIPDYLTKVWEYALQSRRLGQETRNRFAEIIPEVFIAGSDLSQQVGQTAGMALYREAKQAIVQWAATRDLVGLVRIKMGSGEPMQRQGGYYAPQSGRPAFRITADNVHRLGEALPAAARKSVEYATTPLLGVFAASDLRTYQSNISERLRMLPAAEFAQLLHHVRHSQRAYEQELHRAADPLVDTRLQFATRGRAEIERLTIGKRDKVFDEFVKLSTDNFRHIVYGRAEDVVGIHIISYFIARTSPSLRDRPTFRPGRGMAESRGQQIIERIAETIPLSKYGTLLRAIAHNQAQTTVLGVNQLTTGLFRAIDLFLSREFSDGASNALLVDRVLPNLPVYEILHTLRIYHDTEQRYVGRLERAFPAGNSSFTALREDVDVMEDYLGLMRRELIRRQGLSVGSFFDGGTFRPELLPAVRPDLAVLLQPDLFNTNPDTMFRHIGGKIDEAWKKEVTELLGIPVAISGWRERIWSFLMDPIYTRVNSFVELAMALSTLSGRSPSGTVMGALRKQARVPSPATGGSGEDAMKQFLSAAFEYLSGLSQEQVEVPTTVVKAMQEVERIMKIEQQPLSPKQQEELRFCLLQIARLARENG